MAGARFDLVALGEPLLEFNPDDAAGVAGDTPIAAARYANAAMATTGYGAVAPLPCHGDVAAFLAAAA